MYLLRQGGGSAGGGQGGSALNSQPISQVKIFMSGTPTFVFDVTQVTNQPTWSVGGWPGVNAAANFIAGIL